MGPSRGPNWTFLPLLVQNGGIIERVYGCHRNGMDPVHRTIKMSSPSCCNWTRDSGLEFQAAENACGTPRSAHHQEIDETGDLTGGGKNRLVKMSDADNIRKINKSKLSTSEAADLLRATAFQIPRRHLIEIGGLMTQTGVGRFRLRAAIRTHAHGFTSEM